MGMQGAMWTTPGNRVVGRAGSVRLVAFDATTFGRGGIVEASASQGRFMGFVVTAGGTPGGVREVVA